MDRWPRHSLSSGGHGPIANVIAYYQAKREMAVLQTYLINGLTGTPLSVFAAALPSALRRFEGESSILSGILFGAGIVVASLSFLEALCVRLSSAGPNMPGQLSQRSHRLSGAVLTP